MAGFLTVIGFIIDAVIMVAAFACLIVVLQYIMWFHGKRCKHCKHTMEYRGLKPDENNGHYLFHCPHCGDGIVKETYILKDVEIEWKKDG